MLKLKAERAPPVSPGAFLHPTLPNEAIYDIKLLGTKERLARWHVPLDPLLRSKKLAPAHPDTRACGRPRTLWAAPLLVT